MSNIKVYKNVMDESIRLEVLEMTKNFPIETWTQSVCTDEEVIQLNKYMPLKVAKDLFALHEKMLPKIEHDFDLRSKNIKLKIPDYLNPFSPSAAPIVIDRRLPGMSLGPHADIPTGTFAGHYGDAVGTSKITMTGIFYWNDDYEGGELHFHENAKPLHKIYEEQGGNAELMEKESSLNDYSTTYVYKPAAGDFLVFPSETVHSIANVISGERISTQYFYSREE